jgi:hypothetical protein
MFNRNIGGVRDGKQKKKDILDKILYIHSRIDMLQLAFSGGKENNS